VVVVVDDEQRVAARGADADGLRESARVVAARSEDSHPLDHVVRRRIRQRRERLGEPDRQARDVCHRRRARVPPDPVPLRRPLSRERRLAVSGRRHEQQDPSPGLVQERGQPRALDDNLRPRLGDGRALVHCACRAAARLVCAFAPSFLPA
jgi:hypothetical protein